MTEQHDSEKLNAYISLYKQQMDRFNNTQGVEWKANFGIWALLAGACYLVANKAVDVPLRLAIMILFLVCLVHCGWLVFIHDSQDIEKEFWILYRNKAAEILHCVSDQREILTSTKLLRHKPAIRKFVWTSFEVGITVLLCALLFAMLFYRSPIPCLNM